MTRIIQPALPHPLTSVLRNRSVMIRKSRKNHKIQMKKNIISRKMLNRGKFIGTAPMRGEDRAADHRQARNTVHRHFVWTLARRVQRWWQNHILSRPTVVPGALL